MVVWGGYSGSAYLATGARYNPITDTWSPTKLAGAPSARYGATAVWTGTRMIVWGGTDVGHGGGAQVNTGGLYDPVNDAWSNTSTLNAPQARGSHVAIWTGSKMVIWGGSNSTSFPTLLNTGSRYDPQNDTWSATTQTNAPPSLFGVTAIWTGSTMILWPAGGDSFSPAPGARYDPVGDSWSLTNTSNSMAPGSSVSTIWTGTEMLVWGPGGTRTRYNPITNTWTPISLVNAPIQRSGHTAIWTGKEMVIWGGLSLLSSLNDSGRYAPALVDTDLDGDGVRACGGDCDDLDPAIHPGRSNRVTPLTTTATACPTMASPTGMATAMPPAPAIATI